MSGRANPFGDLDDFAPKTAAKPVEPAQIERLAQENNFPSRQAAPAAKPPQAAATTPAAAPAPAPAPAPTPTASPVAAPAPRPHRRYTTGRNQQVNIKATPDTIARFHRLADAHRVPLGELLDQALAALERTAAPG